MYRIGVSPQISLAFSGLMPASQQENKELREQLQRVTDDTRLKPSQKRALGPVRGVKRTAAASVFELE